MCGSIHLQSAAVPRGASEEAAGSELTCVRCHSTRHTGGYWSSFKSAAFSTNFGRSSSVFSVAGRAERGEQSKVAPIVRVVICAERSFEINVGVLFASDRFNAVTLCASHGSQLSSHNALYQS